MKKSQFLDFYLWVFKPFKGDKNNFIAFKDNRWYILDTEGKTVNNGVYDPIIAFNPNYILTSAKELFDYKSNRVTPSVTYKDIALVAGYTILVTENNTVLVYSDLKGLVLASTTISNYETINFEYTDGVIIIYLDGTMGTSIDLNN